MKVITDTPLNHFRYWSGAGYTFEVLTAPQIVVIDEMLEELYPDGMTETEINDFFWFERDTIAEWLGFEDWDELETLNKETID